MDLDAGEISMFLLAFSSGLQYKATTDSQKTASF